MSPIPGKLVVSFVDDTTIDDAKSIISKVAGCVFNDFLEDMATASVSVVPGKEPVYCKKLEVDPRVIAAEPEQMYGLWEFS